MMKCLLLSAILLTTVTGGRAESSRPPVIEVTGSATVNIIPDRITIEIGMEEYYRHLTSGDSTLVSLSEIEQDVRRVLGNADVPDSLIVISDLGNYRNRDMSEAFLMAERLSATVSDFSQIKKISDGLTRNGITSLSIIKSDNSEMERYNRQGLKSALDAARRKAEFIAENEGLSLLMPYEIEETTHEVNTYQAFSNVAYNQGGGMENMRRIVRRYSVKVRYMFKSKK